MSQEGDGKRHRGAARHLTRRVECQRSTSRQARYRAGKEEIVTRIERLDTGLRSTDGEH